MMVMALISSLQREAHQRYDQREKEREREERDRGDSVTYSYPLVTVENINGTCDDPGDSLYPSQSFFKSLLNHYY